MASSGKRPIELHRRGDAVEIPLLVVPGASRERILGEHDGRLRLAVTAPPEGGAANRAVVRRLAAVLGRRRADVTIESGHGSRRKLARVAGTTVEEVRERLEDSGKGRR
jgi:uncharacterized protein (TIGR00251 family)